ncbi:MAG TPA: class II fructose-bisphosphate aldolase [Patescibacteria group bacterium]
MTAKDWLEKAQIEGWAFGAFNIDNLEILKAVIAAGESKKSPVIVEFSDGEVEYLGLRNIVDLVDNARETANIPILLNLDHASSYEACAKAAAACFDMIHFDGSKLDYDQNVVTAKKVAGLGRSSDLVVEGEMDSIIGSSNVHKENIPAGEVLAGFTSPQKALAFVHSTGIDTFAAFFGNVHGTYPNQPRLDLGLLEKIRTELPETFLSMHGGSGIPDKQVREAIKVGKIVKINVNTELRQAFKDNLKSAISSSEYAVYKLMPPVIEAIKEVVESKIDLFGSAGKA